MSVHEPWHEDDAFWRATLPVLFPEERLQGAAAEVASLLGLARVPAGAGSPFGMGTDPDLGPGPCRPGSVRDLLDGEAAQLLVGHHCHKQAETQADKDDKQGKLNCQPE